MYLSHLKVESVQEEVEMSRDRQLIDGLYLEIPNVFVPWKVSELDFRTILSSNYVVDEQTHYYKFSGKLRDEDIKCYFTFHFVLERLVSVTINRSLDYFDDKDYLSARRQSFKEIDQFLIKHLGKSKLLGHLLSGKDSANYTWVTPSISVKHSLYEHFGLDEELIIRIKN
jgi:hypothetical protein